MRWVRALAWDCWEHPLFTVSEHFRQSMYQAWPPTEFRAAIPTDSARWWCHLVPWGLPTVQMVFGLPLGRNAAFVRSGFRARENPLVRLWYPRWQERVSDKWAKETLKEWRLMRLSLALARKTMIPPGR